MDVISYSAAVEACFSSERFSEALRLTHQAQETGLFPFFASNEALKWDLHGHPLAQACMLLADSLMCVVEQGFFEKSNFEEIVVVTGKGLGSGSKGPVLQTGVPNFLRKLSGPEITLVEDNTGRFLTQCLWVVRL